MSSNWLDSYGTSNRFYQSYIQGFVDISGGNLIMRNNSLYLKAGDISLNGNLFVSRDVSLNANVYVKGNVGIGTTNPIGLLDICGSSVRTTYLTNGNVGIGTTAPVGTLHLYESTGTPALTNRASIILEHGNAGGTSSILFKSKTNLDSDYGYIYYTDDLLGSTTGERSALCIGVENDLGNNNSSPVADVLVLNRTGCYVGIGMTNPTTLLQVNGTTTSTIFNALSDYRIKTNVVSLEDTPITVDNLRPVMYTNLLSEKEDIGFIAHELQEHIPFLVSGEKDGQHHQSINYNGMIGILTKEIQELKKENRTLQQRLTLIESKLNIT